MVDQLIYKIARLFDSGIYLLKSEGAGVAKEMLGWELFRGLAEGVFYLAVATICANVLWDQVKKSHAYQGGRLLEELSANVSILAIGIVVLFSLSFQGFLRAGKVMMAPKAAALTIIRGD